MSGRRGKEKIATNPREDTGLALERTARAFSKNKPGMGRRQLLEAALRYARAVAADDEDKPRPRREARGVESGLYETDDEE